jgi:hypothetical protein
MRREIVARHYGGEGGERMKVDLKTRDKRSYHEAAEVRSRLTLLTLGA